MVGPSLHEQIREALLVIERSRVESQALRADNEVLRADNEKLRAENLALIDRVAALESELKKDSTTSSKPPSTDPVGPRQSRAERRAEARSAKRAQGKQPGAAGTNLKRRPPEVTVEHQPVRCGGCGADLSDAVVIGEVRRQVIDLPALAAAVIDHVAFRCRCRCGTETTAEFPPEAKAPVCWGPGVRALAVYLLDRQHLPVERTGELLADLLDAPVSTEWLCQVQLEAAGKLAPFIVELGDRLKVEPVVHADETGTRVRTTKHWMHTVTTNLLTLIAVHPKRGRQALDDIGILAAYTGTVVHDGYASYDGYDSATHAQCGAHLIRHLADVSQTKSHTAWTTAMIGVLLDAKAASEHAAELGQSRVDANVARRLRRRYHHTLHQAFSLLPDGRPPQRRHRGGWNIYDRKAWNLATRMTDNADDILRLLGDTRVPLDNNTAERALRMVKLHDKISGCFHSLAGAEAFADIRSYLQTANNHNENLLTVLHQLFTTGPWLPPNPAYDT